MCKAHNHKKIQSEFSLTNLSPVLRFIKKPVNCFALQNKWLVSTWKVTMGWNGLISMIFSMTDQLSKRSKKYKVNVKIIILQIK